MRSLDRFGMLDVRLIESLDIFIGKHFSRREKDLDDLRALAPAFDRTEIEARLRTTGSRLLADESLRANA